MQLRVLSISTLYPNPAEPGKGLFVWHRLRAAAQEAEIRLINPVALVSYQKRRFVPTAARAGGGWRSEDGLRVWRPMWLSLPGGGTGNISTLAASLRGAVRKLRAEFPFDLLDAQFGYPDGPAVALLARDLGVPYTITLRGSEVLHAEQPARRRRLAEAFRGAARVFCVSERLRQFALSLGADAAKARTLPNGVDSSIFTPAGRDESRRKLGLRTEGRWIAAAGHLIPLKGFDRLIEAVHRIQPEFNEPLQLAIAGEGGFDQSYEIALRGLPAKLGLAAQVRFCGRLPQEDLASLMCAADVFCLASEREGWPNVVHEAMSCGTPVVAANVGAIPEMIPDAAYGRVVAPKDAAALAGGLRTALTSQWDRERISRFAQSRGWRQVASELAAEWRASAAGR